MVHMVPEDTILTWWKYVITPHRQLTIDWSDTFWERGERDWWYHTDETDRNTLNLDNILVTRISYLTLFPWKLKKISKLRNFLLIYDW